MQTRGKEPKSSKGSVHNLILRIHFVSVYDDQSSIEKEGINDIFFFLTISRKVEFWRKYGLTCGYQSFLRHGYVFLGV